MRAKVMFIAALMVLSTEGVAFARVPCIAFVHGLWSESSWTTDVYWKTSGAYQEGSWSYTEYWWGEDPNFIKVVTDSYGINFAVINYDSSVSYWTAAKEVAGDLNRLCQTNSWIVSHSMGSRVVAFIMGNAVSGDPYYNYGGASFSGVRSRYNAWFSAAGAMDGTTAADAVCGAVTSVCDFAAEIAPGGCSSGVQSLQHSYAPQFENGSRISSLLIAGYKNMVSASCLPGQDDGIVEYASAYFCGDHPDDSNSVGYDRFCSSLEDVDAALFDGCGDNPSNKCKNSQKQRTGYMNYDAGFETHNKMVTNEQQDDYRRQVADGYWNTATITDSAQDFTYKGSTGMEIGSLVDENRSTM